MVVDTGTVYLFDTINRKTKEVFRVIHTIQSFSIR